LCQEKFICGSWSTGSLLLTIGTDRQEATGSGPEKEEEGVDQEVVREGE
jgi:hypothetical protein